MRSIAPVLALLISSSLHAQYLADNGKPDPAADFFKAGEKAYRSGDHATAIVAYTHALDHSPGHVNAFLHRGFCQSILKQYEEAVADFTAVIQEKPEHAQAYLSRGSALAKLNRHAEAIADFDRVIALDGRNGEAYNNRGWSRKAMGDQPGACKDWKESKRSGNAEARIILENNRCK
ncbi:MAG: tetratricopeptide repeat protein [Flavobacteriales bacterium]|nr:tetratricopeptide repeat protein [Flavobacteriales bacterium]